MAVEETAPYIAGDPVEIRPNATMPWAAAHVVNVERSPGVVHFGRVWRITVEVEGYPKPSTIDVDCNGRCYRNGRLVVQGGIEE